MISLIQHFEADFLWKVSLKILNSGLILKTFTHVNCFQNQCFEILIQEYYQGAKHLNPYQVRHFVRPDVGRNFLQRLSADDKKSPLAVKK